jgi:hypothetical protein
MSAQFWKQLTRLNNRPFLHFGDATGIYPMCNGPMGWGYLVHAPDGSMVMASEDFRSSVQAEFISVASSMRNGPSALLLRKYRLISMI